MRPQPWSHRLSEGDKAWARQSQLCCNNPRVRPCAEVHADDRPHRPLHCRRLGSKRGNRAEACCLGDAEAACHNRRGQGARRDLGGVAAANGTSRESLLAKMPGPRASSSSTCFGYTLGPATAHDARLARGLPCPSLGGARGGGVGRDGADNIRKQGDGRQENWTTSWTRSVALPGGRRLPAEKAGEEDAPPGRGTRWGA